MRDSNFPAQLGFRQGDKGTHTSRTMMLSELAGLLAVCDSNASKKEYIAAIVEDNALGKATSSTRRLTGQRLSELYGLDRSIPIFRALRTFWDIDTDGQHVIALLVSLARDPLLRCTATGILDLRVGENFDRDGMKAALRKTVGERLNDSILDKVTRNAASSWTQSGHLEGRTFKKRQLVKPTKGSVTMALFLGYLQGIRGPGIVQTPWCRVLDSSIYEISRIASAASMMGIMSYRNAGDVVDIGFPKLLTATEMEVVNESDRGPGKEV